MKLSKRLRILREAKKLRQKDVAKAIGIRQPSYSRYEDEKIERTPSKKNIRKLAEFYQTTPEFIEYEKGEPPAIIKNHYEFNSLPPNCLPVFNWDDITDNWDILKIKPREITTTMTEYDINNGYVLVVEDDSMFSTTGQGFEKGDSIVIDPARKPQNRDYVVIRENGADEATFKQYIKEGTKIYLRSLNAAYPTILLDETIKICGVVIGKFRNFY